MEWVEILEALGWGLVLGRRCIEVGYVFVGLWGEVVR